MKSGAGALTQGIMAVIIAGKMQIMTEHRAQNAVAGVTFPLKQIMANYICVEAIDDNNNKWGIGNNQTGALGNGYMSPSWATNWSGTNSNIYNYSYTPTEGSDNMDTIAG